MITTAAFRYPADTFLSSATFQNVAIHPSSTLHNKKAPAIVYDELVLTTKTYARGVSSVAPKAIRQKVSELAFTRSPLRAETDSARRTGSFGLQQRSPARRGRVGVSPVTEKKWSRSFAMQG